MDLRLSEPNWNLFTNLTEILYLILSIPKLFLRARKRFSTALIVMLFFADLESKIIAIKYYFKKGKQ